MKAKLIKNGTTTYLLVDGDKVIGNMKNLSIKNCQAIERGYDLDELAIQEAKKLHDWNEHADTEIHKAVYVDSEVIKIGFQKALELIGDKKFSEEDVRKAIEIARNGSMQQQHNGWGMPTHSMFVLNNLPPDDIIQSLQQTEWDVEIEMEPYHDGDFADDGNTHVFKPKFRPALDSDGCLILKRI